MRRFDQLIVRAEIRWQVLPWACRWMLGCLLLALVLGIAGGSLGQLGRPL